MKIGQTGEKPAATSAASSATAAADAAKASAAPTPSAIPAKADPSAKIAISSEATNLLAKQGSADFDAEKVARISQQIENKTFKINPEAIADKLISNAKEVLTKT